MIFEVASRLHETSLLLGTDKWHKIPGFSLNKDKNEFSENTAFL
jgi:hypothetical protein